MGREEAYKFNLENFYEEIYPGPISNVSPSHPMRYKLLCHAKHSLVIYIRWLLWSTYCGYILVVPFCYIRIFIYRKFYKHPGSEKHQEDNLRQRRRRNVVSFSCNMAIWAVEALATCVVSEKTQHQIDMTE